MALRDRVLLWVCTALVTLWTPVIALAARPQVEKDVYDARTEGYEGNMTLEFKSTALIWLLFLVLAAVGVGVMFKDAKRSLLAWENGYGRNLEDQADRVGLRYAYEGGFDVECAIEMWSRIRSRFGEKDAVTNWFADDHSQSTGRIKNIRRELQLNYRTN